MVARERSPRRGVVVIESLERNPDRPGEYLVHTRIDYDRVTFWDGASDPFEQLDPKERRRIEKELNKSLEMIEKGTIPD